MTTFRGISIFLFVAVSTGHAGIIHVPGDAQTIQIAISQAQPFDTIIVAPGTYFEAINFAGKVITVQSSNPTNTATVAATIIDAGGLESVVTFAGGEDEVNTILDGFTITNGTTGVNGNGSYAVIRRCVIRDNSSYGVQFTNGLIEDCQIVNNLNYGLFYCDGMKRRCLIRQNLFAGAAYCDGAFEDCAIEETRMLSAYGQAHGIVAGSANYLRCTISRNKGFGFRDHVGDIRACRIVGNRFYGISGGSGMVENSLVAGNSSGFINSQKDASSCTITGNGRYGFENHTGSIKHCIIWSNAWGALASSTTPSYSGTTTIHSLLFPAILMPTWSGSTATTI